MKPIIVFSIVCLIALPGWAQCLHGHHASGACCGPKGCCPECKTEPNEKSCFCIECEEICVPAIKFPWESCCVRKPGKVKVVRKLTSKDYECGKKVVWEWPKPEKVPCCTSGHGCGGHGCGRVGCASCDAAGCAVVEGCSSTGCADVSVPLPPEVPMAPVEMEPTPAEAPAPEEAAPPLPSASNLYNKARGLFRVEF